MELLTTSDVNEALREWVAMGFLELGVNEDGEICFWKTERGAHYLG